jgi:hypothetical protein
LYRYASARAAAAFAAWRGVAAKAAADVVSRRTSAADADAVLAAAAPNLTRHRQRCTLAEAMSTWHLEVTRGQRERLEVGLYKLNQFITHSLKAPGFNP